MAASEKIGDMSFSYSEDNKTTKSHTQAASTNYGYPRLCMSSHNSRTSVPSDIDRPIDPFICRPFQHVRITSEARQDLQAWLGFLVEFNGKTFFNYPPWIEAHCLHLYTDASGAIGYGAILGTHWFFDK